MPAQNRKTMGWIAAGELDPRPYITRQYPLSQIDQAFEDLKRQSVFKAVVKP
jgi:Zn-dependent alcohol dehydrogenase